MRSFFWSGVLTAASVVLLGSPGAFSQELTRDRLVKVVREAIEGKSIAVEPLVLKVSGRHLLADLGGLPSLPESEEPNNPADSPIRLLFLVEKSRRSLKGAELDRVNPWLKKVDKVVDEQIRVLNDQRLSKEEKTKRIKKSEERAYEQLWDDIGRYAKERKLQLVTQTPVKSYPVEIATKPPGGSVHYLTAYKFNLYKDKDNKVDPMHWTKLPEDDVLFPAGNYYLLAKWPDAKASEVKPIKITAEGGRKFVLEPEARK